MKRYYLSPIVGSGTKADPFRAKAATFPAVNVASIIPSNPLTGAPLFPWALVVVATASHTPLLADTTLTPLPDLSLDAILSTLSASQRAALFAALDAKAIDRQGLSNQTAYREVLRRIGRHLNAAFTENAFDVGE